MLAFILNLLVSFSAHANLSCASVFSELEVDVDPMEPAVVLMSGGGRTIGKLHEQIKRGLPSGVTSRVYGQAPSVWIRDWFPLPVRNRTTGQWKFVQFLPQTTHGKKASDYVNAQLKQKGFEVETVPVYLDLGNIISDRQRIFISKSSRLLAKNFQNFGFGEFGFKERIERALEKEVVWLPEVPREPTGHADVFVTYLGGEQFVVADSRDPNRKAALEQTARIFQGLGYDVIRILNAGEDLGEITLSYANSLVIGDRILVPVYGDYVKKNPNFEAKPETIWNTLLPLLGSHRAGNSEWLNADQINQVFEDDRAALDIFETLGFEVVPITMNKAVVLNGRVHCLTRALPLELAEKLSWRDLFEW